MIPVSPLTFLGKNSLSYQHKNVIYQYKNEKNIFWMYPYIFKNIYIFMLMYIMYIICKRLGWQRSALRNPTPLLPSYLPAYPPHWNIRFGFGLVLFCTSHYIGTYASWNFYPLHSFGQTFPLLWLLKLDLQPPSLSYSHDWTLQWLVNSPSAYLWKG